MVIQRLQSLYLLIAALMMFGFSFLSLGQFQLADYTLNFTALGISAEGEPTGGVQFATIDTWYLFAVSLTTAILPLIAIFLFKNMRLQKSLCLVEVFLLFVLMGNAIALGYFAIEGVSCSWSIQAFAPVVAIVATLMARARIIKDQKLLRSADRLR